MQPNKEKMEDSSLNLTEKKNILQVK